MMPPIKILSPEECEQASFVVCARVGHGVKVPGHIEIECSDCAAPIMLAPSSPVKPPKICIPCMMKRAAAKRQQQIDAGQTSFSA